MNQTETNKHKIKRVLALIGVILLVALYLVTLILAFINTPEARLLFRGCIIACIGVPVVLYAYKLIYQYLKKRNN